MNDKNNQKKLVEAFRTFFEKSISPYVYSNENVMNEWKYFARLISSDPIDYSQIEFYILLANKSQINPQMPQSDFRSTSYGQNFKYNQGPSQASNQKIQPDSDKKSSNSKTISSPKKKNLVACLQSFQNMLIKNQERLESFNRKQVSTNPLSANSSKRYY